MLARLEGENGVEAAEVDRRGELLHVRLASTFEVAAVIKLLQDLGFAGEVVDLADLGAMRWYGPGDVGELSREEGAVIAQRVVPLFAQQNGLEVSDAEVLRDEVASALHACFIGNSLDSSALHGVLNDACGRAVEHATRSLLGPDRAATLGRAIEADLRSRSAFKA